MTWFFTDLDPRAKIAGSRDPLGFQQPWTALGRELVGTLTTVTQSVRGFTTLLLGLHLAEQLIQRGEPEEHRARFFLKFEQIAGYSRHLKNTSVSPLGIQKIKKRLSESQTKIPIGSAPEAAILSNQRTYGLWGLYSTSARASGLVDANEQRPSDRARAHLENDVLRTVPSQQWSNLLHLVRGDHETLHPNGRHRELVESLGTALSPDLHESEREFYLSTLVENHAGDDPTNGRQRLLWRLMVDLQATQPSWNQWPTREELTELAKRSDAVDEQLADSLRAVLALDPFFGGVSRIFSIALQASGTRADIVATMRSHRDTFAGLDPKAIEARRTRLQLAHPDRLIALARALHDDDYNRALDLMLTQNSAVMRNRGGSAWAESRGDRIEVRLRSEPLAAPTSSNLFYSYFLWSLKAVGGAVHTGTES